MNPAIPYEDPGKWSAVLLTGLMHGLLVVALVFSVRWQTRHEAVSVELWAPPPPTVEMPPPDVPPPQPPEVKAPEPVRLPPPPAKPEIALKDAKAKPPPKPQKQAPPPAPPADKARSFDRLLVQETQGLDRLKEDRDRQTRAENEAAALARAKADQEVRARNAARERAQADYVARLQGKIRGNLVQPPGLKGNPTARFAVTQLPDGTILDVRLRKASGNGLYDEAVERAIRKSSPLPLPEDRSLFARELEITYCPELTAGGRCPP